LDEAAIARILESDISSMAITGNNGSVAGLSDTSIRPMLTAEGKKGGPNFFGGALLLIVNVCSAYL